MIRVRVGFISLAAALTVKGFLDGIVLDQIIAILTPVNRVFRSHWLLPEYEVVILIIQREGNRI